MISLPGCSTDITGHYHLDTYDEIYASRIFNFSDTSGLIPEKMKHIKGLEDFINSLYTHGLIEDEEKYNQLKHLDKIRKGEL